jgi:ATP-binding cassette subfamily A (ABC1) protein 3
VGVGLCPQHNPLWDDLTTLEHLSVFAMIKGLSPDARQEQIDYFLAAAQLSTYSSVAAQYLSGGTKRKLCAANALIGGPTIQFFDEPTTGLDPLSRRYMWNLIKQGQKDRNAATILTTHSMAEAEGLCDRIGILINGRFVCHGTLAHLKNKYGRGLQISMKVKHTGDHDTVVQQVKQEFPSVELIASNSMSYISFKVPPESTDFKLSRAFKFFEGSLRARNLIDDFSVQQCTLEQIFLYFSKFQQGQEVSNAQVFDV